MKMLEICGGVDADQMMAAAEKAHSGQMRRSGGPYIEHPIEVAKIIMKYYPGEPALCTAALLHDALEDSINLGNMKDEQELMDIIVQSSENPELGQRVFSIIKKLTHSKDVEYGDYVAALSGDPDAIRIKMADMMHNLSSSPTPRQAKKYQTAIDTLEKTHGGPPPAVAVEHWDDLKVLVSSVIKEGHTLREYIRLIIEKVSR
jgi:GTP pyrophosphokinase